MTLDDARGARLVGFARDMIKEALGGPRAVRPSAAWCEQPAATFVTLRRNGALHGCIGTVEAKRSLVADVALNAVAAALLDPRAPPLALAEVDELDIELSLLTPLSPIAFSDEAGAIAALVPHRDGVVLRCVGRQSTFLPQVWNDLPDATEFLKQLKRKAGFAADFWSPDVMLYRYGLSKWTSASAAERAPAAVP
jgi:AmmeMemoRadiSam system protein A